MEANPVTVKLNRRVRLRLALERFAPTRALVGAYRAVRERLLVRRCRRAMRRFGLAVIGEVQCLLDGAGHEVFLSSGTLLGFVREGRPLPHDYDLDFGLTADTDLEAVLTLLLSHGFGFRWAFELEGRITELALERHGLNLDFFVYERDGEGSCAYSHVAAGGDDPAAMTARRWHYPRPTPLGRLTACGLVLNVPHDCEAHLAANYGDWRRPDPHWNYARSYATGRTDEATLPARRIDLRRTRELLRRRIAALRNNQVR